MVDSWQRTDLKWIDGMNYLGTALKRCLFPPIEASFGHEFLRTARIRMAVSIMC